MLEVKVKLFIVAKKMALWRSKNVDKIDSRRQFQQYIARSFCCPKVMNAAFLCLHFRFVLFWSKKIGAKAALKMLVKLTPGDSNPIFDSAVKCILSLLHSFSDVNNLFGGTVKAYTLALAYANLHRCLLSYKLRKRIQSNL